MKQGRLFLALGAALALMAAPHAAHAAANPDGAPKAAASAARTGNSLRQFTGYITVLDRLSLTVEKRGKKPESKSFTKHATMSTVGEVQKEARVRRQRERDLAALGPPRTGGAAWHTPPTLRRLASTGFKGRGGISKLGEGSEG